MRRAVAQRPRDGGHHPLGRFGTRLADVEQHERPGSVRVLRHSRFDAGLTEQRRLLVAGHAADRNAGRHPVDRSAVTPMRPLDGTMVGSASIGTCRSSHSSGSHCRVRMSHSIVRLAFETSVAKCRAGGQVPDQPRSRSCRSRVRRRSGSPGVAATIRPWCRRSTDRARARSEHARAADARRRSARRIARPSGGPATRWPCRTARRSSGSRRAPSRAGW